jgi:hypothetical protein
MSNLGPIGAYVPTDEERPILLNHLRVYANYEPRTPQRDDEVARTQAELLQIDVHDWQRREIRVWFDNHHSKELGLTLPEANAASVTTYQRDYDEPAKLRVTTRKKR